MGVKVQGGIDMAVLHSLNTKIQALAPEIAEEWLDEIKDAGIIPVDTGALHESLTVDKRVDGAAITSDLVYAPIVYQRNTKNPGLTLWFERVKPDGAAARVIERRRGELT